MSRRIWLLVLGIVALSAAGWWADRGWGDSAESPFLDYLPAVLAPAASPPPTTTPTPVITPPLTASPTVEPTATLTPSRTPTPSMTPTPSNTPTPTPTPTPTQVPMVRHWVQDAADRDAVCNDGSDAAYFVRRSPDPDRRDWIIFLRAGGGCWDSASCALRGLGATGLTSSNYLPPQLDSTGILSPDPDDNPDFHDFNHVFIHYCSSDFWAGDRAAGYSTDWWEFRGARIISTVLQDLGDPLLTTPPTLAEADNIIVAGSSAGGLGVHANVDRVGLIFPEARVVGINDGGFVIDYEPFDPELPGPLEKAAMGYEYVNAQVDYSCRNALADEPWRCMLGPDAMSFIETDTFVQTDQRDIVQLRHLGVDDPDDPEQAAYADAFGAAMLAAVQPLRALFSPNERSHIVLQTESFWIRSLDGWLVRDVIGNWYFERDGPVRLIDDGQ